MHPLMRLELERLEQASTEKKRAINENPVVLVVALQVVEEAVVPLAAVAIVFNQYEFGIIENNKTINMKGKLFMKNKEFIKKGILLGALYVSIFMGVSGCGNKVEEAPVDTEVETTTQEEEGTEESTQGTTQNEASDSTGEGTVGETLLAQFQAEVSENADVAKLADSLSKNKVFGEVAMMTMDVEEGYLNGFNEEINGFGKGTMFSPMIGTIPFVGYVFETDSPEDLVKTLEENYRLDWNICTTADEMKVERQGNYVFFIMAPKAFN